MSRYVFDIEADSLLDDITRTWIVTLEDIDTGEVFEYIEEDDGWKGRMSSAKLLIGHNILGYDLPALEKVHGWKPSDTTNIHDTLILSQVLDYWRFGMQGLHSLEKWGQFFKYPKGVFNDFTHYSEEMRVYCRQDVSLNVKVYKFLIKELKKLAAKTPAIKTYLRAEQAVARWQSQAKLHGWPFDKPAAEALFDKMGAELEDAVAALEYKLGKRSDIVDRVTPSYVTKIKDSVTALEGELMDLSGMFTDDAEEEQYRKDAIVLTEALLAQAIALRDSLVLGDGIVKKPVWVANGDYNAHTANWFGIEADTGLSKKRVVEGEYCRVDFPDLKLSSVSDVKVFLYRNGWKPTEWNTKPVQGANGRWSKQRTSPKITEDSLEFLGGDGVLYLKYATTKSRYSILKTWLENVDDAGNLHGDCMVVGTPSMRMRHSIIVNVPSGEIDKEGVAVSAWGPEMRRLFTAKPGWKIIGCDSAGNQARGLAHFLQSEEFIELLLEGDIHQYNADILTAILNEMGYKVVVERSAAKRALYATLFGASGGKLFGYCMGYQDETDGQHLKKEFLKRIPGFKRLMDRLEKAFGNTKKLGLGYIKGIAGNKIYCDSFHKLLVYLLQSTEKATCSAAVMLFVQEVEKRGIPYIPLIMMHDEFQVMVPNAYAEEGLQIGIEAFREGPKLFGIEIMDGSGSIGDNWLETH